MSTPATGLPPKKYAPYVPETMQMKEFTLRALLIGLVMTAILGAANAYLGLKAGMTIAATYPAAVIGMALLRLMKGSLLEENIARTVGSIGESVAAGAVFTIPAFVMAGLWPGLTRDKYWNSVALMVIGGTLGILFVTLLRRVMVEDPDLPYPESVAASEIHKAGQQGAKAAKILFANMGFGGFMYLLGAVNVFSPSNTLHVKISELGKSLLLRTGTNPNVTTTVTGGATLFNGPDVSPAYLGVGYIIGPRLGALNFAGGVLAWGLLVPLLTFTIGPYIQAAQPGGKPLSWDLLAGAIYYSIVRPIAVGGMLVGATYTLFRMRKQLGVGLGRAISDLKKSTAAHAATSRTDRDLPAKSIFAGIAFVFVAMILLYYHFLSGAGNLTSSKILSGSLVSAGVMIIVGFFFAAVSGNLVGMIGSSNNPVSGLTLCTLVIAALLMVALGVSGTGGVAAVLGVAAVVCVSSAVAGEMLQDLKVGYILGGTPAKMQIGDLFGIVVASLVLFVPLAVLDKAYHFGSNALPAPQAGLMAMLSKGIVGGEMAWPLVVVGILLGIAMIMIEVKSVMLFSVGMYLPLGTTFAIFVGGLIRWATDKLRDRRGYNDAQKARVDNAGILTASGLIAGEALCGLVIAGLVGSGRDVTLVHWTPSIGAALAALAVLLIVMIRVPLANAGRPEDPAPPTAIM
ncbi:Oligopeptide transporter OPT [Candidatus Sulfotelmatobacter kueseliae]|uniref:Oligopeptide transporter OPT n=1 Tax=Candidatus Sulfotelmatobacter kueseliae TaxID=2042962 RepID=A0A2U3JW08_9BACT|nr:Oligopeptide transporter OPT [Candidatus Sulfotelmatobacter kueseliae]